MDPVNSLLHRGSKTSNETLSSHWTQFHFGPCAGKVPAFISIHVAHSRFSFSNRLIRFMDAYRKGLTSKQAASARRKYHSHRLLPPSWRKDLEATHSVKLRNLARVVHPNLSSCITSYYLDSFSNTSIFAILYYIFNRFRPWSHQSHGLRHWSKLNERNLS